MPLHPTVADLAWRLVLAILAGTLFGLNRERHGRAAGMRTNLLVCVAAALSMISVNLLLPLHGKANDSFNTLDLMRLPLGVLSGMGFIGAGAILRNGHRIAGVTTAATLWYVTMLGLCLGAGQVVLGSVGTVIGLLVLTAFKWLERRLPQHQHARLHITTSSDLSVEAELQAKLLAAGFQIESSDFSFSLERGERTHELRLAWVAPPAQSQVPPPVVEELAGRAQVQKISWIFE